jgi:uncharacterized tellurite resistance protein B-like protein
MIGLVKKMLGISAGGETCDGWTKERRVLVAATALLLEMAHIDGSFTEDEQEHIVSILVNEYGLQEDEAKAVMEAARDQMKGSIDLWQFTSVINKHFSPGEKERVIEMVWKVVFADGRLDKYEDYLVHNLADLLHLDHSQLIDAKLRVLREREDGGNAS